MWWAPTYIVICVLRPSSSTSGFDINGARRRGQAPAKNGFSPRVSS